MQGRGWTVVRPDVPLIHAFYRAMRYEDHLEWWSVLGRDPLDLMLAVLSDPSADVRMALGDGGVPLFLFGLHPDPADREAGLIWLAGTVDGTSTASGRSREMFRVMHGWVASGLRHYKRLHNHTDARNTLHHRWLKRLGFHFATEPAPYGHLGLGFWHFEIIRSD